MEAIKKETNKFRFYFLYLERDLFNQFILTTIYGRIGTKGTKKIFSYSTIMDASKKIVEIVQKRQTARKRIGVDYEIKNKRDPHGILRDVISKQSYNHW